MKKAAAGILMGLGLALASASQASVIDLRGLAGNFDQGTFGSSGTETYAQSITADDVHWSEVGFGISDNEGGTFELILTGSRAAGLPGTGMAPDANNVLFQTVLNHSGGGLQLFDIAIDIATVVGDVYFMALNAFGETLAGSTVRATQFNGSDKYADGEFIFSNTNSDLTNSVSWSSRFPNGEDLAFRAVFDDENRVPAPATLALLGLGLGVLGFTRRKKA